MLTEAGALLAALSSSIVSAKELGRRSPMPKSTKYARRKLDKGFDQHIDDLRPGSPEVVVEVVENVPKADTALGAFNEARNNPNMFAASTAPGGVPGIAINPNADRVYMGHELGHIASQNTDVGHFVASLRANPKLATALGLGMFTLPGIASAVEAGDNDMDSSVALAALAAAPKLADEALATYHGQRIMDKSGLRTDLGQRGKLAGGLLTYLAAPLVAGVSGNIIGNQFDENTGDVPM